MGDGFDFVDFMVYTPVLFKNNNGKIAMPSITIGVKDKTLFFFVVF